MMWLNVEMTVKRNKCEHERGIVAPLLDLPRGSADFWGTSRMPQWLELHLIHSRGLFLLTSYTHFTDEETDAKVIFSSSHSNYVELSGAEPRLLIACSVLSLWQHPILHYA